VQIAGVRDFPCYARRNRSRTRRRLHSSVTPKGLQWTPQTPPLPLPTTLRFSNRPLSTSDGPKKILRRAPLRTPCRRLSLHSSMRRYARELFFLVALTEQLRCLLAHVFLPISPTDNGARFLFLVRGSRVSSVHMTMKWCAHYPAGAASETSIVEPRHHRHLRV
jgi:hypothetical protein